MNNRTEAVLFDAVGTLFRSRGTIGEIYSESAARYGVTASPAELEQRFRVLSSRMGLPVSRRAWRAFLADVFEPFSEFESFDSFFDEVFSVFRSGSSWRLFPEVTSVLERLSSLRVGLGLVTNFDDRVLPVLDELGISGFFDAVQTAESSGFQKPDPQFFLRACAALGVSPSLTLAVGDDPIQDLRGAERAGIRGLLVDRRPEAPDASFLIRDLTGVLRHLEPARD